MFWYYQILSLSAIWFGTTLPRSLDHLSYPLYYLAFVLTLQLIAFGVYSFSSILNRIRNIFITFYASIFAAIMQPGSAGSVSRLKIAIEIQDKGSASAELVRHLAPLTIGTILKSLPLQDRVHRYGDKFIYIETGLMIGPEKHRTEFHRGDIAYLTSNSSICVFVQDTKVQPMNSLGIVTSNLEVIESSRPGDVMIVKEASV
jgi:hypothetical protein